MSSFGDIPYGATFSIILDEESTWEHHLELMSQAGMNMIRVGDIGSWEHMEPSECEIYLDKLQKLYSLAARFNIYVLLSTGTATPPLWLYYKYPDVRIRSNRGEDYPLGTSYHWACIHHPGYIDACHWYIEELSKFAVKQTNHFGWQISNEIGFPFNPTRETGDVDLYCYCDHTKKAFSTWLKKKYKNLESLEKAWTWSTTNFHYRDWNEIFPPEALPKSWSGVTRWIDWRLFWQDSFADHTRWQHETIRKHDPDHPTMVNTFNFKSYDRFGTYTGLDQWKISKNVDHIGYDLYPGSGNKLAVRPEHISIFLDHGRSISQFAGKEFWLPEVESGPINGWLLGPDRNTDEHDILAYCFESLGHNGKMLLYMLWRDWEFQPLRWGKIVDSMGNPTRRYPAVKMVGEYLQKNSTFIKHASVAHGEVALVESKSNAIFLRGTGNENELFQAQRGAYLAFWQNDFTMDFINTDLLVTEPLSSYKYICLPLMGILTNEAASALLKYVREGGNLIVFARVGTLNEQGWSHSTLPISELGSALGVKSIEADTFDGQKIIMHGKTYEGWVNRDILTLSDETEVIGTFDDGYPAVTLAEVGLGYGIYIATQADGSLAENNNPLLSDVITYISKLTKQEPKLTVEYPEKKLREIDPHILDIPWRTEVIVVSSLNKTTMVHMGIKEKTRVVKNINIGLLEKEPLAFSQEKEEILLNFEIEPRQVRCIEIDWQQNTDENANPKEVS